MATSSRAEASQWGKGGLQVEGLSQSISALSRFDREAGNAVRRAMAKQTRIIRDAGRARMRGRPFGGTYPRKSPQIKSRGGQREQIISINRAQYPWAVGAELGGYVTSIPTGYHGRGPRRNLPRNRTSGGGGPKFANYKGFPAQLDKGRSGTAVIPAIREGLPKWETNLIEEVSGLMADLLRREGVDVTER